MANLKPNAKYKCFKKDEAFIVGEIYKTNDEAIIIDSEGDERPFLSAADEYFFDRFEEVVVSSTPSYYDNSKGSLYKVAQDRGWNPYLFDVVKRLERGGKKDPLEQEIDKTIALLQLWKSEL